MKQECALVILAAGIGSRFGGVKQLEPVGPGGEILMEYSVRDAIEAGFRHIVFIIRKDIEQDFRDVVGDRLEKTCQAQGVRISYTFQELEDLPEGYVCPNGRTKPWGTVQALLACEEVVDTPFAVVNADDYYGKTVFAELWDWIQSLPVHSAGQYCLSGYRLQNTLSDFGGVTRGICSVDNRGKLLQIKEARNVVKTPEGAAIDQAGTRIPVPADSAVSMNLWGFTPDVFRLLREGFIQFLQQSGRELTSELVISVLVDTLLEKNEISVQVLPTEEHWLGVTYRDDLPHVRQAFARLHRQGIYG